MERENIINYFDLVNYKKPKQPYENLGEITKAATESLIRDGFAVAQERLDGGEDIEMIGKLENKPSYKI